jgi:hypothetical protein
MNKNKNKNKKGKGMGGERSHMDDIDLNILKNISKIKKDADNNYSIIKLKIYDKAIQIVKKFLQEKNKILYGGIAINALLKLHGKPIYDENDFPDYDFFSVNPIKDGIFLTNEIYNSGYKYVRLIQAIHQYTVRIQINFNVYIGDISFVPEDIHRKIPYVIIDNFRYITPNFARVQLYKTLCSKADSYRWKKDYNRLQQINFYYKYDESKKNENVNENKKIENKNKKTNSINKNKKTETKKTDSINKNKKTKINNIVSMIS